MREESQADSRRLTGSVSEWFVLEQAEIVLDESLETRQLVQAVAARLREARRTRRLTLRALSEKTGLSEPFLSRLERGRVSTSIANLILITRTGGIDLGQLFQDAGGAPRPHPPPRGARASADPHKRRPPPATPISRWRSPGLASAWTPSCSPFRSRT